MFEWKLSFIESSNSIIVGTYRLFEVHVRWTERVHISTPSRSSSKLGRMTVLAFSSETKQGIF